MAANIQKRVRDAAEVVLKHDKSVGPIELLVQMGFLHESHLRQWQRQHPYFDRLEPHINCGEKKLRQTWSAFLQWANEKNLQPFIVDYSAATRSGPTAIKICTDEHADKEEFFRTHFRPADLSEKQKLRIEKKKNKAPDLVVFQLTSESSICSECSTTLDRGELFMLEQQQPICLNCADLDHLEFLPSGNATLTRRARKQSPLSAIVTRFNHRRKRYERQGVLVTTAAIDAAHAQNESDAESRARRREQAAARREILDEKLVEQMAALIVAEYPGCCKEEARAIAEHTAERGSNRVGRSAAGRNLDSQAIQLAVIAWIRHQHTRYDELLMSGVDRQSARNQIRSDQQDVLDHWRNP